MKKTIGLLNSEAVTIKQVNKIPRALGTGQLDVSWFTHITFGFVQPNQPPDPLPGFMVLWKDTTQDQIKIWDGTSWRTFA
jgi:hypothetical protein